MPSDRGAVRLAQGSNVALRQLTSAAIYSKKPFHAPWYNSANGHAFMHDQLKMPCAAPSISSMSDFAASGDIRGYVSLQNSNATDARINGLLAGREVRVLFGLSSSAERVSR